MAKVDSAMFGSVWTEAPGVLPTWERFVTDVEAEVRRVQSDLTLLSRPVWVVTSSALLRAKIAEALARSCGGGALGVQVFTLRGAALAVLRQYGLANAEAALLFGVLVRREAAQQPALHRVLADFEDGFGAVVDPVRDLLDACWEPELLGGALDWVEEAVSSHEREKVAALLRTADNVRVAMRRLNVVRTTDLLAEAAAVLATRAEPIASRSVFVYGIGDATGRAIDFLEYLIRRVPVHIYLEIPCDPASPGTPDSGVRFTHRFSGRLKPLCNSDPRPPVPAPQPTLESFDAAGEDAEAQTVAQRIRLLLDQGTTPGSILVVARTMTGYLTAIRRHFGQYGIPFSVLGESLPELFPDARIIAAFLDLLARGKNSAVATWIDAFPPSVTLDWIVPSAVVTDSDGGASISRFPAPTVADLRLALATLAARTVADVAQLPDARLEHDIVLPVRHGLVQSDDGEPHNSKGKTIGRKVPRDVVVEVRSKARTLVKLFDEWPTEGSFFDHTSLAKQVAVEIQAPESTESPVAAQLLSIFETLGRLAPTVVDVSRSEFLIPLRQACAGLGEQPLGGAGTGVLVIGAALARGVVADHLFLIGLNTGRFPRVVREDPLLPDAVRIQLAQLLPDLPIKSLGHDEERFLFAQCLSSAPRVTLSWQRADVDGHEMSPSVLIERLRINRPGMSHASVPRDIRRATEWVHPTATPLRSAYESALYAAIVGDRSALVELLPRLGLVESPSLSPNLVALARLEVLAEVEPDKRTEMGRRFWPHLSPYMGLVGPPGGFGNQVSITAVEQYAACPWQTFLTRVLQLQPPPESRPVPPGISANLIGNTVHLALQHVVDRLVSETGQSTKPWTSRRPIPVLWPSETELREICAEAAKKAATDSQLVLPGLHRALADLVMPYIQVAAQLAWGDTGGVTTLGAEVAGMVELEDDLGRRVEVRFRADRADQLSDGTMELIDYKTGKPPIDAMKAEVRTKHLLSRIAHGGLLQGVVYALAGPGQGRGTYVYLRPELDERKRLIQVTTDDEPAMATFRQSTELLLGGMVDGVFFPRLELPNGDENPRCEFCPVTDACNRGDSGSRRRLREWVQQHHSTIPPVVENNQPKLTRTLAQRLSDLWWLGEPKDAKDGGNGDKSSR